MASYDADTYNAVGGATLDHIPAWSGIGSYCRTAKIAVTTALAAADTINFMTLPAGSMVQDMTLSSNADIGVTTCTIDVGDVDNVDRYIDGGAFATTTGSSVRMGNVAGAITTAYGVYNSADVILLGTVVTLTGGGTTDGTLVLNVWYTMDRSS